MRSEMHGPAVPAPPVPTLPPGSQPRSYGEIFATDVFRGTAHMSIPIPVLPGRGAPSLALTYTPDGPEGLFGLGVSLHLPAIERRTDAHIPTYTEADQFFGPDGEELTPGLRQDPKGAWECEQRTAVEGGVTYSVTLFRTRISHRRSRVEHWRAPGADFWKVRSSNNGVSVFGRSPQARIADPANPGRIWQWLIEEEQDARGNRVRYTYKPEDGAGWNGWVPEGGFANRYPTAIAYGNYQPGPDAAEQFAFELRFDYGEYDLDSPGGPMPDPVRPWALRPDTLTTCRPGFPVQTLRLCRSVLVLNHLPSLPQPGPTLSTALRLSYDGQPACSRLASATLCGFRREGGGYETSSLPPLTCTYADFDPAHAAWQRMGLSDGSPLPGIGDGHCRLADLDGEGAPGVLYSDPESICYFPPIGEGRYGAARPLPAFPNVPGLEAPRFALQDVTGDGRLSLAVLTQGVGGFFYNRRGGSWEPFRPFTSHAPEAGSGAAHWVDLTGDGMNDVLVQTLGRLRIYYATGSGGFDPPAVMPAADGFPDLDTFDEATLVTFADMMGDGLAHCVHIRDGRVSVWPNLGYGRFAASYSMEGTPRFGPGLTRDRIVLGNFCGTARSDLLLAYPDRVELYQNLGAGFAPAVCLPVPGGIGRLDQVQAADVGGNGHACLVVASPAPSPRQIYLDVTKERFPNRMMACANDLGGSTHYRYRSSTSFYLADRKRGIPWSSSLAHPVTVIDRLEHCEAAGGLVTTTTLQYRNGYYDPVEKRFRGFGFIQAQNAKAFNPAVWLFAESTRSDAEETAVSARLTRHWFHTGAGGDEAASMGRTDAPCFDGDPDAVRAGATSLAPEVFSCGGETARQAWATLAGEMIRREVYAVDEAGSPAGVPLLVEEHSHRVDLVQPAVDGAWASFRVAPREVVAIQYEGVANDPRVEYEAVLAVDRQANPTCTAAISYPRRRPQLPAQEVLTLRLIEQDYVDMESSDCFLTGQPWQYRASELAGIIPPGGAPFTFDDLAAQVAQARLPTGRIPYGSAFTGGPQARLYTWDQTLYWDEARQNSLPPGQCAPHGLICRRRSAAFPDRFAHGLYGDRISDEMLSGEAGYEHEEGYWWHPGDLVSYYGPEGYCQPRSFRTPFQTAAACTTVVYDEPYWLCGIRITDPLGAAVVMQPDYQTMEPAAVTAEDGVVTEGLYDPLGRVLVLSEHGAPQGCYQGSMTLSNYRRQPPPSLDDLLAAPGRYLQGAASYYCHLDAAGDEPTAVAVVTARLYPNSPDAPIPAGEPAVSITFVDGFGRTIEMVQRVEAAALADGDVGWSWVSDRRIDFDSQGRVLRRYLPAVQPAPQWHRSPDRPCTNCTYDALDREVCENLPKGFLSRTQRPNAWEEQHWDEDDTVRESPYYRQHIDDPDLPPEERRALEQAAGFSGTPTKVAYNPRGFAVARVRVNVAGTGETQSDRILLTVDVRGLAVAAADPRQGAAGAFNSTAVYDMQQRPLRQWRADAGESLLLPDALNQPLHKWQSGAVHLRTVYEGPLHRPVAEEAESGGSRFTAAAYTYGTDPSTLSVNRVIEVRDQAGVATIDCFDLHGEPARTIRRFARQKDGLPLDWSRPDQVPLEPDQWCQAWERDALGQPLAQHCADGSVIACGRYANGWISGVALTPPSGAPIDLVSRPVYEPCGHPVEAAYSAGRLALTWRLDPLTLELTASGARRASDRRVLQALAYTLDPAGNLCCMKDSATASLLGAEPTVLEKAFTFDALYRLTAATGWTGGTEAPWRPYRQAFTYDQSDNLVRLEYTPQGDPPIVHTFTVAPGSNRAVPESMAPPPQPPDPFFNEAGNLVRLENGTVLAYDPEGRLVSVTPPENAGTAASYRHDAHGLRIRRCTADQQGRLDLLRIGPLFVERRSVDGGPETEQKHLLIQTPGGVRVMAESSSGACRYLLPDRLGSVLTTLDDQGSLLAYEDYYPFGEVSIHAAPGGPEPAGCPGFGGKEFDAETGLAYFGGRHYVPSWGRWLTPDPKGEVDGLNLYLYVGDNPMTLSDPTGYGRVMPNRIQTRSGWQFSPYPTRLQTGPARRGYRLTANQTRLRDLGSIVDVLALENEPAGTVHREDGGWITYLGIVNGQRGGVRALVTPAMVRERGTPAHYQFPFFTRRTGTIVIRGHLLARVLGGSGYDNRNLVPLYHNQTNLPMYTDVESRIQRYIERNVQPLKVEVIPDYTGRPAYPNPLSVFPSALLVTATTVRGAKIVNVKIPTGI